MKKTIRILFILMVIFLFFQSPVFHGGFIFHSIGVFAEETPPDTEAPSSPDNFACTDVTATTVDISWDASTDNVGVFGYEVYSGETLLDTVTGLNYTVAGLSPSTTYSITIKAKDAANNISDASSPLTVTTLLSTPNPLAQSVTDKVVSLSWESVQCAEGYDIEVDGTSIDNGSYTTYTHNNLTQGTTHTYRVKARNTANNSEWSNLLSVTTFANVNVGGTISANTTWTYGKIYNITSNLTVAQGVQLDIEPGVIVKASPSVLV